MHQATALAVLRKEGIDVNSTNCTLISFLMTSTVTGNDSDSTTCSINVVDLTIPRATASDLATFGVCLVMQTTAPSAEQALRYCSLLIQDGASRFSFNGELSSRVTTNPGLRAAFILNDGFERYIRTDENTSILNKSTFKHDMFGCLDLSGDQDTEPSGYVHNKCWDVCYSQSGDIACSLDGAMAILDGKIKLASWQDQT